MINFKGKWIAFFCMVLFLGACNGEEQGITEISLDISNEKIMQVAQAGLMPWLSVIPVGSERSYGFSDRAEFAYAQIGEPVRMYGFKMETKPEDSPIMALNNWDVPVVVDGSYRVFLYVRATEDEVAVVGIGSSVLAREIGEIRQSGSPAKGLLRVYSLSADFIIESSELRIDPNPDIFVFPMRSAQDSLRVPASPLHIRIVIEEIEERNDAISPPWV